MSDFGLQIVNDADISQAADTDFVINSKILGGMKIYKKLKFLPKDGVLQVVSAFLGLNAYVNHYKHGLGYVPAYIAFKVYAPINGAIQTFNNFNSVNGDAHYVNVDSQNFEIGFDQSEADSFATGDLSITLIIFAEKLADS